MKNTVTEQDVVNVLQAKGDLSINDIANEAGTLRNILNPVITTLINKGVVAKTDLVNGAPQFRLTGKALDQATPATTRLEVVRSTPAPTAAPKAEPEADNKSKSQTVSEPTPVAQPTPRALSVVPQSQPVASDLAILAYLTPHARSSTDMKGFFGDCQNTLDALLGDELVSYTHIIDQMVYEIQPEAYVKYPQLSSEDSVEALLKPFKPVEQPAAVQPAPVQNQPVQTPAPAKGEEVKPVVQAKAAPVTETPAPAPVAETPAPAPVVEKVTEQSAKGRRADDQQEIQDRHVVHDEFDQSNEEMPFTAGPTFMAEIGRLIEREVRNRMEKEALSSNPKIDVDALKQTLLSASKSLQDASKSLQDMIEIIDKGNT